MLFTLSYSELLFQFMSDSPQLFIFVAGGKALGLAADPA